jgi:hypothetical protein
MGAVSTGGGGGSGFVFTEENYNNGYTSLNYIGGNWGLGAEYFLDENSYTIAGDSSMPSPDGGTIVGKTGNGYAKITMVEADEEEDVIRLTLNGEAEISILVGSTYEDAGATLIKNNENISEEIIITGSVNTEAAGEYTITYSYEEYSVTRTVIVTEPAPETDMEYNYTGAVQTYVVPRSGRYKLETWGAERRKRIYICNISISKKRGRKRRIFNRNCIFN